MDLKGKAALVTGAGGAIGRAICSELAVLGATVVGTDVDEGGLEETISQLGEGHYSRVADLTDAPRRDRLVASAVEATGRLDILVNNAGFILARNVVDCTEEEYDQIMSVNTKAPFFLIKAAIPHMLAQGSGAIINIASISALVGLPEQSAYCASKGALLQLTKQVAVDYSRRGIKCNAVCPGTVQTPLLEDFIASSSDPGGTRDGLLARHPVGRFSTPDEISRVVAFLASDDSSFIHGAAISVDGGYVAW